MNNINFTYDENISIKKCEPLLNCNNIKLHTEDDYISNYFFNMYLLPQNEIIIEELKNIYEYSQKVITTKNYLNTINRDSWLQYKISKNISINLSEKIIKFGNIIENENGTITSAYNNKTLNFNNKELYDTPKKTKPLFKINSSTTANNNENILYLHKEGYCENNIEFLYYVLNCIFNSNTKYYIKICERCNKFFLTNRPNKKMCNRKRTICNKETICCNASKVFYKSKEYKRIERLIENHLKPFYGPYKEDSEYIGSIRNKYAEIKENYIANKYPEVKDGEVVFIRKSKDNMEEDFIKKAEELISTHNS